MFRAFTAVGFILWLSQYGFAAGQTYFSYWDHKTYISELTDEDLKMTPSWDETAENPPLSARKAIKLATDLKTSLVQTRTIGNGELSESAYKGARRSGIGCITLKRLREQVWEARHRTFTCMS